MTAGEVRAGYVSGQSTVIEARMQTSEVSFISTCCIIAMMFFKKRSTEGDNTLFGQPNADTKPPSDKKQMFTKVSVASLVDLNWH